MEDFIVARYLYEQRNPRYIPSVSVQMLIRDGGMETHLITDRQGGTCRDLNRALEMDLWLLNRWRNKHASGLQSCDRIVGFRRGTQLLSPPPAGCWRTSWAPTFKGGCQPLVTVAHRRRTLQRRKALLE